MKPGRQPRLKAFRHFLSAPIPHFFFACLANTLFLAIFLRKFESFVADFMSDRPSFIAMILPPSGSWFSNIISCLDLL
jgi:hypothetical protein